MSDEDPGPAVRPHRTYQLMHHRRLPVVIVGAAATTVVAGSLLLIITSNGLDPDILFDVSQLGYTVGGVSAILTFAIGALYVFPRTRVVKRTLGRLVAETRPPTPEEHQTLARTGSRVPTGGLTRAHRPRGRRGRDGDGSLLEPRP